MIEWLMKTDQIQLNTQMLMGKISTKQVMGTLELMCKVVIQVLVSNPEWS